MQTDRRDSLPTSTPVVQTPAQNILELSLWPKMLLYSIFHILSHSWCSGNFSPLAYMCGIHCSRNGKAFNLKGFIIKDQKGMREREIKGNIKTKLTKKEYFFIFCWNSSLYFRGKTAIGNKEQTSFDWFLNMQINEKTPGHKLLVELKPSH